MKVSLLALSGIVLFSNAQAVDLNVTPRGNLNNARVQFQEQKKGHVAFFGGIDHRDGGIPPDGV